METMENATKPDKEPDETRSGEGHSLDYSLYRQAYSICMSAKSNELRNKQRKTNLIWISLNVRLLHRKVCHLLS